MKTRAAVVVMVMVLLAIAVGAGLRWASTVATPVAPQDTVVTRALDPGPRLNWGEVMVSLRLVASDLVVTVTDASAQRRTVTLPGNGPRDFAPVVALVQSTEAKTCITDPAGSVPYADVVGLLSALTSSGSCLTLR